MEDTKLTSVLTEDSRSTIISKSRSADAYNVGDRDKGLTRYDRRVYSKILPSKKEYNSIDMNKLFKDNILDVKIKVKGETGEYTVQVSFGGLLKRLQDQLKRNEDNVVSFKDVMRALINTFNGENVYVRCDCPDFRYRQAYYLSKADAIAGPKETRPSDITNPGDTKGRGCKHILLCMANNTWMVKVAAIINNYIHYMEENYPELYQEVIYPALFEKELTDDDFKMDIEQEAPEEEPEEDSDVDVEEDESTGEPSFQSRMRDKRFNFDDLVSDDLY